ncbi:hypothetical protein U6G28_00015 [Actinomycetaceae bacterium MB13-C1-2]|nr:hypothetical protein U6G28_00015 [Actinomycetaceae bacterium MB13-C1-2]
MFAVIADQINSRHEDDAVRQTASEINRLAQDGTLQLVLSPQRTSGDEFQCLVDKPDSLYRLIRLLMEDGRWHIGIGIGDVETPLPEDVREARGSSLLNARQAVNDSKSADPSIILAGKEGPEISDANAVLRLISSLLLQRTRMGWEAVHATEQAQDSRAPMSEAADTLGITKQALSQRLQAAHWKLETESQPTVLRALTVAEQLSRNDESEEVPA